MSIPEAKELSRETLERFRSGDPVAFEAVIRAYAPLVRAIVRRFWRSVFEQEEAVQEIWIHAFRQRGSLDPARLETFRSWLSVLARRRALDLLRAEGRSLEVAADDEDALWDLAPVAPRQEQAAEERELEAAVAGFASRLKPAWRSFFELHFVQGLDYAEVAKRLSISRLRCKYMRKVLASRASRHPGLMAALGRAASHGGDAS